MPSLNLVFFFPENPLFAKTEDPVVHSGAFYSSIHYQFNPSLELPRIKMTLQPVPPGGTRTFTFFPPPFFLMYLPSSFPSQLDRRVCLCSLPKFGKFISFLSSLDPFSSDTLTLTSLLSPFTIFSTHNRFPLYLPAATDNPLHYWWFNDPPLSPRPEAFPPLQTLSRYGVR